MEGLNAADPGEVTSTAGLNVTASGGLLRDATSRRSTSYVGIMMEANRLTVSEPDPRP